MDRRPTRPFGTLTSFNLNLITNNTPRLSILATGNVGIGTTSPGAALDVNGAIFSEYPADNTSATIDFSKGNLQTTSVATGAFTLTNLQNGGSYSLIVTNTTNRTFSFSASGFTVNTGSLSLTTTGATKVIFTFLCAGNVVYVTMNQGY